MHARLALASALLAGATASAQQYPYQLAEVGASGWANAWGLAEDGAVAGILSASPFVWYPGTGLSLLPLLPGYSQGVAYAFDSAGNICGSAGVAAAGLEPLRAVRFRPNGTIDNLGTLGGLYSEALEMNRAGHIVGSAGTLPAAVNWHAFLWREGLGMLDLAPALAETHATDVSDFDAVTGAVGPVQFTSSTPRAFRYTLAGGLVNLGVPAGFKNTIGLGINNAGQICGTATSLSGLARAWMRHTDGIGWQVLLPNAALSTAWKINDFGQVVGDTNTGGGSQLAAVYTDGVGMQDLNSLIDPATGWQLMAAHDVDERGFITGYGRDKTGMLRGYRLEPKYAVASGHGCAGSGGHVPALGGWGVPAAGNDVQLMMAEAKPNGSGLLFLSWTAGSTSLGACTWLLGPPLAAPLAFGFDVRGQARIAATLPPGTPSGISVHLQFASLDPGAPNGAYALSNALELRFP